MTPTTVAIVGPGVVGTALGAALRAAGHRIVAVAGRTPDSTRRAVERIGEGRVVESAALAARVAETVLLTVPDRAIEDSARAVAADGPLPPGRLVLHTSGYHTSRLLAPVADAGGAVGSLHPLQSFATVDDALRLLPGTRCFFEGDEPDRIRGLIEDLRGVPIPLRPDAKPLYHAAAATASNLLVTVVDLALEIASRGGLDREEMLAALLPLVEGSVRNLATVGLPGALTGPIARGDVSTVEGHLRALTAAAPDLVAAYAALARHTADVAVRKGTLGESGRIEILDRLKNVDPPGGAQ